MVIDSIKDTDNLDINQKNNEPQHLYGITHKILLEMYYKYMGEQTNFLQQNIFEFLIQANITELTYVEAQIIIIM